MAVDIVATVVPNVSKVDNDHYYFYVFLTPRISCSERQKLVNFRHIYNWTDYFCFFEDVKNIQFRIYDKSLIEKGKTDKENIKVMDSGYRGDVKVLKMTGECSFKPDTLDEIWEHKGDRYKYAKLIWRSMFDFETPVDGWELDKEPFELAGKISPMEILSALREYISGYRHRLLNRSLSDLGIKIQSNSRFEEDTYKRELLGILDSLYSQDINGILNSPYLTNLRSPFKPFFEELRKELKRIKNSINEERNELALKLGLQDVEERNSTETKEFHKKMAAYGNFPYLLKQTGWIWEFRIEKKAFAGRGGEEELFISVIFGKKDIDFREWEKNGRKEDDPLKPIVTKPNDTDKICSKCGAVTGCRCCETRKADFEDNINFLYPVTAIKMDGKCVDYRFQQNGYLEIKNSIIQLPKKNDPYSFIALLEDKNEQFEKIAELLRKDFNISDKDMYTEGKIPSVMDTLTEERRQKLDVLVEQYKQVKKENSSASTLTDYSSSGISVYLKGILQSWEANRINSPLQNLNLESLISNNKAGVAAVVFGHNLHKGYRPDVSRMIDDKPTDINSLCKRWVFYSIQLDSRKVNEEEFEKCTMHPGEQEDGKASPERFNPFECYHLVDEDEGWVLESMQGSNSGKYYVDEELFRWNDWSLCANKLFKNDFKEDDGTAAFIKETSNLNIFSIPVPGSLPKLRYGNKYNFRLRFVDICGGGKTFDPADRPQAEERILTEDILYVRIQGLTSPLVYLSEELHEGGVRTAAYLSHSIGEDVHTLMIRSHYNKDKKELVYDKNTKTSRYIGPAQLDFQLVKKHGCFDDMISPNGSPKDKTRRMIELTRGLKKPQAGDLTDTNELILTQNGPINYLYDPLVNGYDFYINKLHEDTLTFRPSNTYIDSTKELKYTKLKLNYEPREANGYDYKFSIGANAITVRLQQGMEKELEIDSTFKDNLEIHGTPVSTPSGILKNRKVLKSRSTLRLLHAVQKPCLLYAKHKNRYFNNAYENLEIPAGFTRELNNPAVKATFYFNEFPCLTSESYILHALYIEKTGCRNKKRRDGSDNTDGYDYIYANRIIKTGINPDREGIEQAVYFSNIEHTFNDTKSRYVYYKMEAISRFKKYFPEEINDFSVFGYDGEEADLFTAKEEPGWKELNDTYNNKFKNRLAIPSSNQPPALVVDRIVPLIKWEGDINTNTGIARICDTIRIYFEGDWFTTGDDEQVALFYTNFETTTLDGEDITVNSSNVPIELVNAISELGNDPAAKNHGCDNIPIINEQMLDCDHLYPKKLFIKNLDFENNGHSVYSKEEVKAALYDIKYMCPQGEELLGKYYVDIKIGEKKEKDLGEKKEKDRNFPKDFYFPFFRFAIARYQPHTIPPTDVNAVNPCFSKITLTDFVQLLPYRKLILSGSTLTITTKARRESERKEKPMIILPNIMQVIQGGKPENSLPEICEKASEATLRPEEVIDDSTVFKFEGTAAGPFEIEEYEQYDSKMEVDKQTAFKNDFRKRLIFSYYQP